MAFRIAESPDDVFDDFINTYVDVTYEDVDDHTWSPDQRLVALQDIATLGIYPCLYQEVVE
jgi:hypothetical protein